LDQSSRLKTTDNIGLDPGGLRRQAGWMTNRICVLSCCLGAATLSAFSLVATGKPETRNRAEISDAYKWDVSKIYPSWDEWEADLKVLEGYIASYAALKGTLAQGAESLVKAYEMEDEIGRLQYKLYCYTSLQRDVDTRNSEASGKFQRVLGTASSWFTPELLQIPEATTMEWINAEPKLVPYRFPISENYRQASHTLNEDGEKLMSFSSQFRGTPGSIYQELSTSDVQFPTVKMSDGTEIKVSYGGYSEVLNTNRNQADREAAFKGHYETYAANKNTYAAIYNSILQRDWFSAQARNYPTTLAAALDSDNVPESVYRTLVETVRAGTGPAQRYMKVRQKMLGLETYHLYDGSLPLLEDDRRYAYDDMKATLHESVAPLGQDYQDKMSKLLNDRCLDVYESDGKRSGAYSMGVYGVGPYMLMNYNDTLDAVFTFAHEAGHSMHTVLSHETQPFATASYTIFVAEVASTTNERFLLELLLSRTEDPKERFLLLQHAIDNIVGTFYTQVMFADYEWQAHQLVEAGQPVTPESLAKIYSGLLDTYYGDAATKDELYRYTWTRIPHFYNSPYYVYKYATCFASSAQIFKAMTTGSTEDQMAARERYLTLLRSGGNDQPMAQLLKAGVDLNKRETIQAVVDQMDGLVTRLEAEAAKIKL
jgi:oligoendopeptidase F